MTVAIPIEISLRQRYWLLAILLVSAAVKLIYVFGFTAYPSYLFADSEHYFSRAQAFFNGERPYQRDWEVFPMGYTVLTAAYWRLLALFGLTGYQLESALVLNVINSTATLALTFHLAAMVWRNVALALWITGFCGFFFPLVFLNTFIISEHFAQLFFIASLWALVRAQEAARPLLWMALAGVFWALTCQVRASFGLAAAVATLMLLCAAPQGVGRFRAVAAYVLPATAVFALAGLALWVASDRASYKPTGSNGGFNFFMVQCHYFGARSIYETANWFFYPAIFSKQPELGTYVTKVPFSDQAFYFSAAFTCIWELPDAWQRIVALPPTMLYSRFFPEPGIDQMTGFWTAWYRHINVLLILLAPAGCVALRRQGSGFGAVLLAATGVVLWIAFAEFNADHRHVYSLIQIAAILGIGGAWALVKSTNTQKVRYVLVASVVTALSWGLLRSGGPLNLYDHRPQTVSAKVLTKPIKDGTFWSELGTFRFWAPLTIELGRTEHAAKLHLALDSNDVYRLGFYRKAEKLGEIELGITKLKTYVGMVQREVQLPSALAAKGYDRLRLEAISGDGQASVGNLRFDAK